MKISDSNGTLKRKVALHCVMWAVFITYEMGMLRLLSGKIESAYVYPVYYAMHISFFYGCIAILDYSLIKKRRYVKGAMLYLLLLCIYCFCKILADRYYGTPSTTSQSALPVIEDVVKRNLIRSLYFTALALFYWSAGNIAYFRRQALYAEKLQLKLAKENAEMNAGLVRLENAYLRQQIQPHMMFNALAFVYSTVEPHSKDGARCLWLLSELLRYSLSKGDRDGKVMLESETTALSHLIEINRFRFMDQLQLEVNVSVPSVAYRILPLILLTLAENLFKHGDLTATGNPSQIAIMMEGNKLIYRSSNRTKTGYSNLKGLGLDNVRTRLEAAYPGRYEFTVHQDGGIFNTELYIDL